MAKHNLDTSSNREKSSRKVAGAMIIAAVPFLLSACSSSPTPHASSSPSKLTSIDSSTAFHQANVESSPSTQGASGIINDKNPDVIVSYYLDRVAKSQSDLIANKLKEADAFFGEKKKSLQQFRERANEFTRKRKLTDMTSKETSREWEHFQFMKKLFEETVVSEDKLYQEAARLVDGYVEQCRDLEMTMLSESRKLIAPLSPQSLISQLSDQELQESYDSALNNHARENRSQFIGRDRSTYGLIFLTKGSLQEPFGWVFEWWTYPNDSLAAELDASLIALRHRFIHEKNVGLKKYLNDMWKD